MASRRMKDERGNPSLGKALLLLTLTFTLVLVGVDSLTGHKVQSEVWGLLGTINVALIGWTAGPRIAQYLLPQLGAIAQGIAGRGERYSGSSTRWLDDDEDPQART